MTPWDWLTTPIGIEFTHAVILVLVALSAWIGKKAHDKAANAQDLIKQHSHDVSILAEATRQSPLDKPPS